MNFYPERLEELHAHLEQYYGQRDRQATEIILASLLKTDRDHPWLILETDWLRREFADAWFSLGGETKVHSLAQARVQRAPVFEAVINAWMSERQVKQPALFVEPEWRRPTAIVGNKSKVTHSYAALESLCVRLRVDHPRCAIALMAEHERRQVDQELGRLTRRVLDNHDRETKTGCAIPRSFLYWCELLQRLCARQTNWDALIASLTAIAINSGRLSDSQIARWEHAERVMRDTIPHVTRWIVEQTCIDRSHGIKAWKVFTDSGQGFNKRDQVVEEIRRLAYEEVLVLRGNLKSFSSRDRTRWHPWRYRIASREYEELIDRSKRLFL